MQIGPYQIEDEIGRGGAGVVFRALGPRGPVALKLLGGQSEAAFARFQREVQLQAELTGEGGFVPVLDAGQSPRGPYLVMPILPGGTLRERLRQAPRGLPLTELFDLGGALASAIGRAHDHGLVHRDLKPENVLFDHLGCPQIADLGLAKAMESTDPGSSGGLSKTGELRGTLGYMPPEQLKDSKRASASSDVFALGAILYECATGVAAFSGQGPLDVMDAIRSGRYQDPRSLRPDLSKPLARLIASCLATDPDARPADGRALAQALATLGLSRPHNPAQRVLLVGVVALAGVGAAVLGYQVIRRGGAASLAAASPDPVTPPASPAPALSALPSPSAPTRTPTPPAPSPRASPSPTPPLPSPSRPPQPWRKARHALAQELDKLESIVIDEQLGTGDHRSATPIQALFFLKEGTQLAVWDEDFLWTYSFPGLQLLRSVRLGFATLAERRDPDCVRVLDAEGRCFVTSVAEGAFVHSEGKGLRITLASKLVAAAAFSPLPLAALAAGERVTLVSTADRELLGTLLHADPVVALATAPGSNRLLSVTTKGTVSIWEISPTEDNQYKGQLTTLEGAKHLTLGPQADVWAVASAQQIRVQSLSGKFKTLDVNLGEGEEPPTAIRISADGEHLLILSERQITSLRIRDREVARRTKIPAACASLVDGTGDRLVYAAQNSPHLIRSNHIPTDASSSISIGHVGAISAISRAPEGVVVGDDAGGLSRWSRGICRYVRLTPGPISEILHQSGRTLVARRGHPSTEISLEDGLPTTFRGESTWVSRGAHGQAVVGEASGVVRVLRGTKQVAKWRLHQRPVLGARLLPRKFVASWAEGEQGLLVSLEGKVHGTLPHLPHEVVDVAPLLQGALAVGTRPGQVFVYDVKKSRLLTKIDASQTELTCLAGHRSGRLLLVGDRDGAVRIFHWKGGELKLREEVDLSQRSDFLSYARQGETLDDIYFGTARGVVLLGRWPPVKDK